ncbi:MAG: hypothetical protein JWQ40_3860 [Segetibacter sp.]|nr:hypothetical protein [Segetibacter sp.]
MKNSSIKKNYKYSNPADKNISDDVHENKNISPKAVKPIMTEQIVVPPARVWNRIEKILDEQDKRAQYANTLIAASFRRVTRESKRKKMYVAAGVSLFAGMCGIFYNLFSINWKS